MIVQTAPPGEARFVIRQQDHAAAAGQLAEAFGNAHFGGLEPRELMIFVTRHHDDGWRDADAALLFDAATGLPYHLSKTPLPTLLETSAASPAANEEHHPYCGLLSSMHSVGLYCGRYGLFPQRRIDRLPTEQQPSVRALIAAEEARQQRLRPQLAHAPESAAWVEEAFLMANYRRLEFFDLLALYLQLHHPSHRHRHTFPPVPAADGSDVSITITPQGPDHEGRERYRLEPYPFADDPLLVATVGRTLTPQPDPEALRAHFHAAEALEQVVVLHA